MVLHDGDVLLPEDEIIEVGGMKYSMRKVLSEDGWQKYLKANDKVKDAARLCVRIELSQMEIAFKRLHETRKEYNEQKRIQDLQAKERKIIEKLTKLDGG